MFNKVKNENPKLGIQQVRGFLLPNQGSNLDFTDPESVVLPITPLGTEIGCKNTVFLNSTTDFGKIFSIFLFGLIQATAYGAFHIDSTADKEHVDVAMTIAGAL